MLAAVDPDLQLRPLYREEYDHLVKLGYLSGERVELLYGMIVQRSPANDPRLSVLGLRPAESYAVEQLTLMLVPLALAGRARVRIQSPFAASDASEPEPDVLVCAPDASPGRHPTAAWLVVEVADTSIKRDLGTKATLYAEAGVSEYWVVNLGQRCVEVFRAPIEGQYTSRARVHANDTLRPAAFPDLELSVARLFHD
jgi:Uma2 family endonuclease